MKCPTEEKLAIQPLVEQLFFIFDFEAFARLLKYINSVNSPSLIYLMTCSTENFSIRTSVSLFN
jgi:hypothetical protein